MKNRQWLLAKHPDDQVQSDTFLLRETECNQHLEEGQVLVRNRMFAIAPTMRNYINDGQKSYTTSVGINEAIVGPAGFEVVKSRNSRCPVGARFLGTSSWQDYVLLDPDRPKTTLLPIPSTMSMSDAVGVYGLNSLTAYFGLMKIGEPKPNETLVVSGAAGSVGSIVAQIGRIMGCRVIGIAGGSEKCGWLSRDCGIDHVIDYKSEDVRQRLAALCPGGIDIFFDNVGGDILQAVMDNIAKRGRVIVCGQISAYDSDRPATGPADMMKVVYWSVKIQGFVLSDFLDEIAPAQNDLIAWVEAGEIVHREDIRDGFESLPNALMDILKGRNQGTLMVKA